MTNYHSLLANQSLFLIEKSTSNTFSYLFLENMKVSTGQDRSNTVSNLIKTAIFDEN